MAQFSEGLNGLTVGFRQHVLPETDQACVGVSEK